MLLGNKKKLFRPGEVHTLFEGQTCCEIDMLRCKLL